MLGVSSPLAIKWTCSWKNYRTKWCTFQKTMIDLPEGTYCFLSFFSHQPILWSSTSPLIINISFDHQHHKLPKTQQINPTWTSNQLHSTKPTPLETTSFNPFNHFNPSTTWTTSTCKRNHNPPPGKSFQASKLCQGRFKEANSLAAFRSNSSIFRRAVSGPWLKILYG